MCNYATKSVGEKVCKAWVIFSMSTQSVWIDLRYQCSVARCVGCYSSETDHVYICICDCIIIVIQSNMSE